MPTAKFCYYCYMPSLYLDTALEAVRQAEEVILKYLDEDVRAELKEDDSPVTVADKEAEAIIKKIILERFPDHTFFGEEGEKVDLENHRGFTWIIDPIDGTKSYLRKNPLFATELALMHDGEFILGVSNAPMLHELIYAEKDKGCFLNGEPLSVSGVDSLQDAYMSFGSLKYFENTDKAVQLMNLAKDVRWARGIGDFWSYHLLVQGKLDIMIEAQTKLWDIAAFTVIVREAGGRITHLDGCEIDHTTTTALATNGLVHDDIVSRFKN